MVLKTAKKSWSRVTAHRSSPRRQDPPLPAPVIPASALAPLAPEGVIDGLLKASVKDDELSITVPIDPNSWDGDEYFLVFDGVDHGSPHTYDESSGETQITMPLTADVRLQGKHLLSYRYYSPVSGKPFYSEMMPVIVDLTPAGYPETLPRLEGFDPRLLSQGLSLDLLNDLGDQITSTLGAYGGSAEYSYPASGDVVTPYIGNVAGTQVLIKEADLDAGNITVVFTKAHIELVTTDGVHDFYYTITDRAGNVSANSAPQPINFIVNSAITDLEAPVITTSSGMILEADARAGVKVTILGHASLLTGDQVVVVWGGNEQPPGPVPGADTDFDVTVDWLAVNEKGSGDVDVDYYITRNGGRLGTSPATTVKVDLTVPGGEDPTPETPENENIKPLSVFGDADNTENVITIEDSAAGGKAVIPWLQADDTTEYFAVDDLITIIWNGVEITPPRIIDIADLNAKIDIEIPLESATLLSASGDLNVQYKVSRAVTTAPDFNASFAPIQVVAVKSADDAPGGTGPLGVSVLPDERYREDPNGNRVYLMGLTDSQGGTRIEIPHYLNKKAGDKISVTFTATEGQTPGGPDIPDAKWSVVDYEVPAGDEESGASFFDLPEENLLAIPLQANGSVTYSVENSITKKPGVAVKILIDNR